MRRDLPAMATFAVGEMAVATATAAGALVGVGLLAPSAVLSVAVVSRTLGSRTEPSA